MAKLMGNYNAVKKGKAGQWEGRRAVGKAIDKGDRRQAPETGQLVAVRPLSEARKVGAYGLDQ